MPDIASKYVRARRRPRPRAPGAGAGFDPAGRMARGWPTASRMVGRMSTCRAATVRHLTRPGWPRRGCGAAQVRDDQRNAQRRLVREDPVRFLAVIAEPLSMVAGHDDERRPARVPHVVQQRRQRRVGGRHFAVVGLARRTARRTAAAADTARADRTRAPRRTTAGSPARFAAVPAVLPAIQSRASGTTADAGRSGMLRSTGPNPSPKRSSYTSNPAFSPKRECSGKRGDECRRRVARPASAWSRSFARRAGRR